MLTDVQTFVAALDTMFGGFRERADATYPLLQAPGTAFLVVAAPERDALREASYFVERLGRGRHAARRAGAQPGAHRPRARVAVGGAAPLAGAETLDEPGEPPARPPGCCGCTPSGCARSSGSSGCAAGSPRRTRRCRSSRCPRSPGDVHDLAGLRAVGAALAGS